MTIKGVFLFAALSISLCTSFSCGKKQDSPSGMHGDTLPGTWEIRGMWGPLIDTYPGAFKPGNGDCWSFSLSEFKQRTKDTVYNEGTYSVDHSGLNPVTNQPVQRFIFNGVAAQSFELRNDTLFVYSTAADGFQATSAYVKISSGY